MNQSNKTKLQAVKKRLDDLRGDVGTCLGVVQDIYNVDENDDVQEAIDILDEMDDKFNDIDNSLAKALA